jgi:tRNA intron endonuclease, catalytic C-terminal domain
MTHQELTTEQGNILDWRHAPILDIVRAYYEHIKHYHVYSGLQFGCHYVLYADNPAVVHSDFAIYIVNNESSANDGRIDWYTVQTLVRMMPDLHKTLILVHVTPKENPDPINGTDGDDNQHGRIVHPLLRDWTVHELAVTTEHAPFRHQHRLLQRNSPMAVGTQQKTQHENSTTAYNTSSNDASAPEV